MSEQGLLDYYFLGTAFAGVILVILIVLASSRASLSRVAFRLAVIAEICLLVGALLYDGFISRVFTQGTGLGWWMATSLVLIAAGAVTGVVALALLMRELALRGASGWVLLCAVGLLVLVGAYSSFTGYNLVLIFAPSFALRLLRSVSAQRIYYGVVSLLLVCSLLPALVYSLRSGRAADAPASAP